MKFGPYVLESRIAVGGTAEVYLAHEASTPDGPKLVVKRMLPDFLSDAEGRTMFAREAALHASVRHPNVVKVIAAGETEDGEPYLAMEWIDGLDAHRLLRRVKQEGSLVPIDVAAYIAHDVLRALASVHTANDKDGNALAIVHRDVTPSNIYLSRDGEVKLGDFGIARAAERANTKSAASAMLKGKFAYLAPEQVAGEPFDCRSDIFSLATVLSEILLGDPLFPGQGQLAVLLAIRDCRIDALASVQSKLPPPFYDALLKGLARDADRRWATAGEFADALAPFVTKDARATLGTLVSNAVQTRADLRDSAKKLVSARPSSGVTEGPEPSEPILTAGNVAERATGEYTTLPSFVRTRGGAQLGPWQFARIVEAIATSEVGRGDQIDYMGNGYRLLEEIDELARFLPMITPQTSRVEGPGKPDATHDLTQITMLEVLLGILERDETGVLFAERTARATDGSEGHVKAGSARKELYFIRGRLHHVASSNASELFGEYLVRRGKLTREELDMALAVLPRNQGRMGDTLISLGLVSPVDIFQAIREQGRDRVADLFMWKSGMASFYRGQSAQRVEFPLDLDLPTLILAGMEAAVPGESALERYRTRLHQVIGPGRRDRPGLLHVKWPPQISAVEALARRPRRLSEILSDATRGGHTTAGGVLRIVDVLLASKLVELSVKTP